MRAKLGSLSCPAGSVGSNSTTSTSSRRSLLSQASTEPIHVAVRLRPLREDRAGGTNVEGLPVWRTEQVGNQNMVSLTPGTPRLHSGSYDGNSGNTSATKTYDTVRYYFDLCFDGKTSNHDVFDVAARDVIRSSLEGVNSTVLAYGQTNSGKTHSILGTIQEPGILPMGLHDLFKIDGGLKMAGFVARVSYYEIFNERVIDLLASGPGKANKLPVKEDAEKGFYVQGLSETPVHNARDVLKLIERGEDRRCYAQTRWNDYSSRSHVLFTLSLQKIAEGTRENQSSRSCSGQVSKLSVVDLAGCENHKYDPSEDGRYINRSLFFLGEVISRLCNSVRNEIEITHKKGHGGDRPPSRKLVPPESSAGTSDGFLPHSDNASFKTKSGGREASPVRRGREIEFEGTPTSVGSRSLSRSRERGDFIPYRDSKLTRVLRSSLGGNAITLLLVTVHPAVHYVEQTMTSLRFASKARCVENCIIPADVGPKRDGDQSMIDAQQLIIEGLQNKLRALELQRGSSTDFKADASYATQMRRLCDGLGMGDAAAKFGLYDNGTLKDMADSGILDSWMRKQFQNLHEELEQKKQQLAMKTQLLSEREQQLGQLREQLVGCKGDAVPVSNFVPAAVHSERDDTRRQPPIDNQVASASRHGPPDEGGGLPVVDVQQPQMCWTKPVTSAWGRAACNGNTVSRESHTFSQAGYIPDGQIEAPSAFQQIQSRAEDIVCLRSSRGYVTRQQLPLSDLGNAPVSQGLGVPGDLGHFKDTEKKTTQEEMVEKLLHLAVMQINSVQAGPPVGGTAPADAEVSRMGNYRSSIVAPPGPSKVYQGSAEAPPPSNPNVQTTPRNNMRIPGI